MLNCRLKSVAVSVSNVKLMERVSHLMDKIYREILCITTNERMPVTYISVGRAGLGEDQVKAFSLPPQYRIVLSWDLLVWISVDGRIPCSFTNFITTPELSGPLYISSDIYHTQITEYLLHSIEHRPQCYYTRGPHYLLIPDRSFWEHLSRALPTEMIFDQFRKIPSDRLFRRNPTDLMLDTPEIIVKWLQGLGSERPSDLNDRFQGELLRCKAKGRDLRATGRYRTNLISIFASSLAKVSLTM